MATDATAEKAQDMAGQVQEKAGEAAQQAKGQLRTQVDQRSTQAGEQVSSTASDIRQVAESLRTQGQDKPAQLAQQAADRAERLGSYLTESDADRILGDVEDFARRQPWAVVGAGLFLGFAASRLLKASSTDRYHGTHRPTPPRSLPTQHFPVGSQEAPPRFEREGDITPGALS